MVSYYSGGRHTYRKWKELPGVGRVAVNCKRHESPDLQSNCIKNPDGSEVLRYIRLDIDCKKTLPQWKNKEGAVCWKKISGELKTNYPAILRQIEYVTRSHSQKGLHVLVGLAPLPLEEKTSSAQFLARRVQSDLVNILNELGIGADREGLGLKQDFATYRNRNNLIHHNAILTKKIESEAKKCCKIDEYGCKIPPKREKFLTNLWKSCQEALEKLEIKGGYRLYPDLRLEPKIAKLFLFTLGLYAPENLNANEKFQKPFYAKLNSIELSLDEIATVMETEKRNIYGKFWEKKEIQALFNIEKTIHGYSIAPRDARNIAKRIQRARSILNYQPCAFHFSLTRPEEVEDGSRNRALVSWILALKWYGFSEEQALSKVLRLVRRVPGCEVSSACKRSQLKLSVSSVYRNRREMFAAKPFILPEWLEEDDAVQDNKILRTTISHSRRIQCLPLFPLDGQREEFLREPLLGLSGLGQGEERLSLLPNVLSSFEEQKSSVFRTSDKLTVVRWKQRVGVFSSTDELLILTTNSRHFKLSGLLKLISSRLGVLEVQKLDTRQNFFYPKKSHRKMKIWAKQIDAQPYAQPAGALCGYKEKYDEKILNYANKKAKELGISFKEYMERFKNKISKCELLNQKNFGSDEIPF